MTRHIKYPADRCGFSLIELLTLMVVLLVVTGLAAPSMRGFSSRMKTQRALDRIANDIAFARMAAVRSGSRAVIEFSTGASYTVRLETTPPRVVKQVSLTQDYQGVQVTAPTTTNQLVFDSRGLLLTGNLGAIKATAGGVTDSALITATGRLFRAY